jgi:Lipocalin-like domain
LPQGLRGVIFCVLLYGGMVFSSPVAAIDAPWTWSFRTGAFMRAAFLASAFLLALFQPSLANELGDKLVGVWMLDSFIVESVDSKERRTPYGEKPNGYLVITPERFTALITGQGRKAPQTDEDRVNGFRTMFAYSGPYTIEGDRLTTRVQVSWNEGWVGTDQVRIFKLNGDKLNIESLPAPGGNQQVPGLVVGILAWSRSK